MSSNIVPFTRTTNHTALKIQKIVLAPSYKRNLDTVAHKGIQPSYCPHDTCPLDKQRKFMPNTARSPLCQAALVTLTMLAFAANSVLCRLALKTTTIDPASFTTIRLTSGALTLALIVQLQGHRTGPRGTWPAAFALFTYAAAFSYAYSALPTAVGALILFGAVQVTMIAIGLKNGECFTVRQSGGFALAIGGLIFLLLPGLSAPEPWAAAIMLLAGIAWGGYSLLGRKQNDPSAATAGNFILALPFTLVMSALAIQSINLDTRGMVLAIASGAIASGMGYSIWYAVLPTLSTTLAATLQLSVPVIATLGGIVFLNETLTLRLFICSLAILGGIALVIACRQRKPS